MGVELFTIDLDEEEMKRMEGEKVNRVNEKVYHIKESELSCFWTLAIQAEQARMNDFVIAGVLSESVIEEAFEIIQRVKRQVRGEVKNAE